MKTITMITICLVDFLASTCFAIIASFFPAEAEQKGLNNFEIGAIFGIFQGIQFFVSPIFGLYIDKVGVKKLYLIGIGLTTVASFLFGFTTFCYKDTIFMLCTFALRLIQGLGCAAFLTSSYVMIVNLYPTKIGTTFGIIQMCGGLGFSIGPAFGGFLHEVGGYITPFITVALCLFVLFVISLFTIPKFDSDSDIQGILNDANQNLQGINDNERVHKANDEAILQEERLLNPHQSNSRGSFTKAFSFFTLFTIHPTSLTLDYLVVIAGTFTVGFIDPSLEPHTRELGLGLTSPQVGALFLALSAPYTLISLALGRVLDTAKFGNYALTRLYCLLACLISALALALSGPSPLVVALLSPSSSPVFSRQSLLVWIVVSQMILGVGFAGQIVLPFTDMMKRIRGVECSIDLKTRGLVSGLYSSALALGAFLGPFLGGLLTQHLTYPWASTAISAFNIIVAGICLSLTAYEIGAETFTSR